MKFLKKRSETVVIAPKEETEEKSIGNIIAERIEHLAYENKEGVVYAAEEISKKINIKYAIVEAVMRGSLDLYLRDIYPYDLCKLDIFTVLSIIRAAAEYFNTSTDYILGLTDRVY